MTAGSRPAVNWLAVCRRSADGVRQALRRYPTTADRAETTGRGQGGDIALVIDRAAEDAVFAELEALGQPLTAVSEERGEVPIGGGGQPTVVIDPIDGSLNAKRGLPFFSLSIAVAEGRTMGDASFGYVVDLASGSEWWARGGEGAFRDGEPLPSLSDGPLEVLALEVAHPRRLADAAPALPSLEARRVRAIGSVALSLCLVADGRLDAMLSLGDVRSVDAAAGQLILREAGGALDFPAVSDPLSASLGLEMRSRVLGARSARLLERLRAM